MSYAQTRLDLAGFRLARLAESKAADMEAEARADAAAEREERRDRARADAERCRQHQQKYDAAFAKFGRRAPPPLADAHPPDYRRALFGLGQAMLARGNSLTDLDPYEIDGSLIARFEKMLLGALETEAEKPSGDNLPDSPSIRRPCGNGWTIGPGNERWSSLRKGHSSPTSPDRA